MLPANNFDKSDSYRLTESPNQNKGTGSPSNRANRSPKRYFGDPDSSGFHEPTSLAKRVCRPPVSDQAADNYPVQRAQLGGKGMFLQRMKKAGLPVPPFECVTAQVTNALEQHPLDTRRLDRCLPGIVLEPGLETSLANVREYLNALPPSDQAKRNRWLADLAQFVASDDYYEQVKDSEAARQIRDLRRQLSTSQPVIVRSSGINEDNYGDAQAGKYLSLVQGEDDVLRTCLKVMASAYQPAVCSEGIPQPMALIIQHCVDCRYGGVAMSFQSFQDDTVRVEYTPGQPGGVVAGQSGNKPHRIDISRIERPDNSLFSQYFPGTVSSQFILQRNKNNNGYSETRLDDANPRTGGGGQRLSDDQVSALREMVTQLEDLLLCPVDVEFAIDHQDRLFLLQVRPITRLSGGMDFAMSRPGSKEILAIGNGVSEGYCTGPVWLAKKREADSMPEGAIVVARHAEEWMLEPGFLRRAGGFAFDQGGFNDHVAILMKQEEKTLMLAGGQYLTLAALHGRQVTLASARFKGIPSAFIVAGDLTRKLASHRSLSCGISDVPLTKAVPSRDDLSPPEGTFRLVASGFQWLTDQNARLLAFFASGGGLDCLANPVKLSISPQRSKLLAETVDNVNRLIHGAEALLEGYRAFLLLAGNSDSEEVQSLLDELMQLTSRFVTLKQTIQSGLESITRHQQTGEGRQLSFIQWVADCYQLKSCLQALNPGKAEQVLSVHELIFALHQRFVKALAPVTLASGHGRVSEEKRVTYVDCTTPGDSGEKATLLSPSCKASIKKLEYPGTVVSMDDALIVNLELGSHICVIELLENAEGGKGRTLRLKFSDQFRSADGSDKRGKLMRMWFLVQLLKVIKLDKQADSMKLSCSAVTSEMIVEYPQMKSREILQEAFEKLTIVLDAMCDLDLLFSDNDIFEEYHWDFNMLAQRLNPDVATEADRFTFQHCLFSMFYLGDERISPACCQLLSNHLQQFVHYAERLGECQSLVFLRQKPENSLREILMSNEMSESIRRELLHHYLLLDPHYSIRLVEDFYPHLRGQYFVIKPSRDYTLTLDVPPSQSLLDIKEKIRKTMVKGGLKYVSQRVRNDQELVLEVIAVKPLHLKYVSEELKCDKGVVMAAVTQDGYCLSYASQQLQDDDEVVMAAMAEYPRALQYASERIQSDKSII